VDAPEELLVVAEVADPVGSRRGVERDFPLDGDLAAPDQGGGSLPNKSKTKIQKGYHFLCHQKWDLSNDNRAVNQFFRIPPPVKNLRTFPDQAEQFSSGTNED
jgi:hypothetical protein